MILVMLAYLMLAELHMHDLDPYSKTLQRREKKKRI